MRVIRILEYEGTPGFLKRTMNNRKVRGSHRFGQGSRLEGTIKEAILGDISDFIGTEQEGEKYKEDTDA